MKISPLKSLEHGFKKTVFFLFQIFLRKGMSDLTHIDPSKIRRVLFIRPEKLGDMIISLPVFYNLKTLYPHLELYTICSPRNVAIIRDDKRLTGNFLYTKNTWRDFQTIRQIRRLKFDAVVDMICDDSVTSLFLTQFSSPTAYRIGIGKKWHRPYYDFNYVCRTGRGLGTKLPQPASGNTGGENDKGHVIDTTLKLLTAFGISTDKLETYVPPAVSPADYEKTDRFLSSLHGSGAGSYIGLNISAGRPSRVWAENKNIELVRRLLNEYPNCCIVVSSDPHEREKAVAIASNFPERVFPVPENLNLLEISAIISRMKILITPDTSLVHIARAFKVPVVGLYTRFGKNFEMWKPYGQDNGAVISNNDYNIFDISVDDVYNTAVKLMMMGRP